MDHLKEQIEEAQRQVEIRKRAAARPNATIEDELRLQCARNWLLTLENRVLNKIVRLQKKPARGQVPQPKPKSAKDRAEAAFASLQKVGS
ncbi:hypothetical protein [Labrenzia sp. OB1]|uniref:hypothetical protein n=1 Tax=Labrenzia sp. OB1 TaxID=1561204 RepID=UPI0007B25288|nr:hypothetical protein [Labrenzia sp. OB1]KZM46953.1 hypothetical protein OA90_26525 [Labrenzia sp. OB1]